MWNNAESYGDIKDIAIKLGVGLYTALHNPWSQLCTDKDDCHGKLHWQQESNGVMEYFESIDAYEDSIKVESEKTCQYNGGSYQCAQHECLKLARQGTVMEENCDNAKSVICGGKFCNETLKPKMTLN